MLYLAPMLTGSGLVLAIRCCARIGGCRFKTLDANGDDRVTATEFVKLLREKAPVAYTSIVEDEVLRKLYDLFSAADSGVVRSNFDIVFTFLGMFSFWCFVFCVLCFFVVFFAGGLAWGVPFHGGSLSHMPPPHTACVILSVMLILFRVPIRDCTPVLVPAFGASGRRRRRWADRVGVQRHGHAGPARGGTAAAYPDTLLEPS